MSDLSFLVTSGAVISALVSVIGALAAVLTKYKVERRMTHDAASPKPRGRIQTMNHDEDIEKLVMMVSELRKYQVEDKDLVEKIQRELQRIQSESKSGTATNTTPPRKPSDA
jgi:hypothetical protein